MYSKACKLMTILLDLEMTHFFEAIPIFLK